MKTTTYSRPDTHTRLGETYTYVDRHDARRHGPTCEHCGAPTGAKAPCFVSGRKTLHVACVMRMASGATKPARRPRVEAAAARETARGHREETTREVARNRARDVVSYGVASRSAVDARAAVDCARETYLVREVYVAAFLAALTERGVALVP